MSKSSRKTKSWTDSPRLLVFHFSTAWFSASLQQADSWPAVVTLAGRQRQRCRLKASISNGALGPADAAAGLEPASVAAGLKPAIMLYFAPATAQF